MLDSARAGVMSLISLGKPATVIQTVHSLKTAVPTTMKNVDVSIYEHCSHA